MHKRGKVKKLILVTFIACLFPLSPMVGAKLSKVRTLELQLGERLSGRVLVFRALVIQGRKLRFDSSGEPLAGTGPRVNGRKRAILFIDVKIGAEQIVILGEAVSVGLAGGETVYRRDSRQFDLVNCTIVLDQPASEVNLPRAMAILSQIFFTQREFEKLEWALDK